MLDFYFKSSEGTGGFIESSGESPVLRGPEQNRWACAKTYFRDIRCPRGNVISVTRAFFGEDEHKTRCVGPGDNDCRESVETRKPLYYSEILRLCQGQQECHNLIARQTFNHCARFGTDYVIIYFRCLSGKNTEFVTMYIVRLAQFILFLVNFLVRVWIQHIPFPVQVLRVD